MKLIILVAVAFVAVAVAAPSEPYEAKIIRSEFEKQPEGSYVYSYETDNGISRAETGEIKQVSDAENKPHDVVVVRGSFSYIDSEGKPQSITYVADEYGYRAEGESIPKPVRR